MSMPPPSDEGFLSRWARRKAHAREGAVPAQDTAAPAPPSRSIPPESASDFASAPDPALAATAEFSSTDRAADEGRVAASRSQDDASAVPGNEPAPAPAPAPTLADVAALTRESDFSPFVARGVGDDVKRAAMKKLFTDPRYNVMDGLDTYIGDYNTPDPIPPAMLSHLMAGFPRFEVPELDAEAATVTATATPPENPPSTSAAAEPVDAELAPHASTQGQTHDDADLQLQQDDAAGRPGAGEGARA
ncbi:MAG: DUF3306 domain-containing protein [Burkholderiaceae bacterium]